MPPTRAELAKIHIAKKELGMSDDAYRDLLRLHFGVESARDLSPRQVTVLLNKFRAKGWRPRRKVKSGRRGAALKKKNFKEISSGPNARQKRYILALWNALGYDVAKPDARVKRQFGIDRFEWLHDDHALFVLATDLRQRCRAAGIDPEPY